MMHLEHYNAFYLIRSCAAFYSDQRDPNLDDLEYLQIQFLRTENNCTNQKPAPTIKTAPLIEFV